MVLGAVRACSPTPACGSPAGSADPFRRLVAAGITAWLVGQATINIGGVIGLLPITGLPLPFISDGGSALVVTLAAIGMLASFARAEPDAARALHARPPGRLGPATLGAAAARCRPSRGDVGRDARTGAEPSPPATGLADGRSTGTARRRRTGCGEGDDDG